MINRLALTLLALAAAAPLYAQDLSELEEQFQLFQAEDVVVSASKHEQKASEAPSAVYVITSREIQSSAALTVSDLLRRVPGFDVYRVNQGYSIIGARGQTTESNNLVLVLLDGREINVELFGIPFVEQLPITLDEIDRIEVIRGPGSALYGANAFSGVVNIITKRPKDFAGFHTFLAGGTYGNTNLQARTAGFQDKFGYSTSARFRRAYLFSDPGELDVQSSSARGLFSYEIEDDSKLEFDVAFDNSRTELFTTIGELPAELFQSGVRVGYDLGHFRVKFFWNLLDETLAIQDPTLNPPGTALNRRILTNLDGLANTYDLESQYLWEWSINTLIAGGNLRWNSFSSEVLSDTYANEYRVGLFLQDEFRPIDNLVFTLGGRLDYYLFDSPLCTNGAATGVSCNGELQSVDPAISPRLSIVYTPVNNQTIRLSGGRAFRKPAFFERQMQVAALERLNLDFANPELPNESMTAVELGYVTRIGDRVKLNVDTFFNQYENFIQFQPNQVKFDIVKDADGNPAKVSAYGGEIVTKIVITSEIEGGASYAHTKNTSDDIVSGDPEHKVNVEATYRADYGLVANVLASYISEREWRISDPEKGNLIVPFTVGESLGNYTVLDARLGYRFWSNRLEAGLLGKNLLDEHREFPGIANSDVDRDPFTERETFGGERIARTAFAYVEGHF